MKRLILGACLLAAVATVCWGGEQKKEQKEDQEVHSLGHKVLFYLPNRVFDIFDMVRLRLRVGPGLAAGVRVTDPVSAYVGAYVSVYAGLPGPRQEPKIPLPAGLETYNGATLSFVHLATGAGLGPDYSPTEIGASLHLLIIGADVDVDPMEFIDLLAGLIALDPRHDDF